MPVGNTSSYTLHAGRQCYYTRPVPNVSIDGFSGCVSPLSWTSSNRNFAAALLNFKPRMLLCASSWRGVARKSLDLSLSYAACETFVELGSPTLIYGAKGSLLPPTYFH